MGGPWRRVTRAKRNEERLWEKIDASGDCWLWTASISDKGYGHAWNGSSVVPAHRRVYEVLVGPIPEGLELDHLCRVRSCVNPDHLEPVTTRQNVFRGISPTIRAARVDECLRGHSLLRKPGEGTSRRCLECARAAQRDRYQNDPAFRAAEIERRRRRRLKPSPCSEQDLRAAIQSLTAQVAARAGAGK